MYMYTNILTQILEIIILIKLLIVSFHYYYGNSQTPLYTRRKRTSRKIYLSCFFLYSKNALQSLSTLNLMRKFKVYFSLLFK